MEDSQSQKQETGEADCQQQAETEKEEVYSDLNKTPGLRKEVCRKGEKAMKEEGESKTVGEEIPRTQAERGVTEQSATDARAAQALIPNETACSTGENKEEEQEHQKEEVEKRAHLGGAAAEGSEEVELKEVKKTRRGKRGKKKKRVQTENKTDWSDYDEEDEEESGWGTYSLHRKRAEESWCDGVASPPESDLRQRFYPSRQICYRHYYYNRVERRREGKEEEERRGRPQRGSFISPFRDRRLEKSSRQEEEEEEGRGRAWPDHCRQPVQGRPYIRGGFYPRERWMNDHQEGLYPRERWMSDHQEGLYPRQRWMNDYQEGLHPRQRWMNDYQEGLYPRQRWMNDYQEGLYPRQRWMNDHPEGLYPRERWMNDHQEGLYPRQRWMTDNEEAMYTPGREYMERERRLETGAWLETGTELWNRHWEEVEGTGVGMRLSFCCPWGRERGNRWSYQRVRRQLVKHSAQR